MDKDLHALFNAGPIGNLTDGQLLERFVTRRDPLAFEAIVERHGAMVLRVCHAVLNDPHDAQDAFQATFLVLVKRAHSIRRRDSIASWLFGVADRVSRRARVSSIRRRARERRGAVEEAKPMNTRDDFDLAPVLHDELRRLPEKYRAPVVLCYLEGRSCEDAATQLHWPLGTVKTRLFRARDLLRARLTRRGLTLPAGLLAAGAGSQVASAAPPTLIGATVQGALAFSTGQTAITEGLLTSNSIAMAEGVLRTMSMTKLLTVVSTTLIIGVAASGAGVSLLRQPVENPPRPPQDGRPQLARLPGPDEPGPKPKAATAARPPEGEAIHRALLAAGDIKDPADKAEALLRIAAAQIRRDDRATARETLELAARTASMIAPNAQGLAIPHVMTRIAQAQAEAGDAAGAHRSFQRSIPMIQAIPVLEQPNHWINLVPAQLAAEGRQASRETIEAYRRYLKSDKNIGQIDILSSLAGLEVCVGGVPKALATVLESEEFRGPEGAPARRSALLSIVAMLREEDRDVAGPALAEARAAVDQDKKAWSRANELAVIALAQARLSQFKDAVATTGAITAVSGQPPRADGAKFNKCKSYLDIAELQLKAGDKKQANATAFLALLEAETIELSGFKVIPLQRISHIFIQCDDIQGSLSAVDVLRKACADQLGGPTVEPLLEIATAQQNAGDKAGARESLLQALAAAEREFDRCKHQPPDVQPTTPADSPIVRAAVSVASIQARLGDMPAALRTVDSLGDEVKRQYASMALAGRLALDGDVKSALELVGKIPTPQIKQEAWIRVASCLPAKVRRDKP